MPGLDIGTYDDGDDEDDGRRTGDDGGAADGAVVRGRQGGSGRGRHGCTHPIVFGELV